jgi:predicted secreted hydrolase
MLFFIREEGGSVSPASSGTYVDPSGNTRHLEKQQIRITVLNTWKSPKSNAIYPSQWEIKIPDLEFRAKIQSNLANQELDTAQSTGVTYWEGSVSVNGKKDTKVIQGHGYAELTGYNAPFRSPL